MNKTIKSNTPEIATTTTKKPTILNIIEQVMMRPDMDVDKIERVIEIQQKLEEKEAEKLFNTDLSQMIKAIPEVAETTRGHNSHYAAFEHIQQAIKPVMAKYGFSLTFDISNGNVDDVTLTGCLRHKSGHKTKSSFTAPLDKSGNKSAIHATASTVSYLERYLTITMLNVTTHGTDDDAFVAHNQHQNDGVDMIFKEPCEDEEDYIHKIKLAKTKEEGRWVWSTAKQNGASQETIGKISSIANQLPEGIT